MDDEVDPVFEETEINAVISTMFPRADDASQEVKIKLETVCLEYWDVKATDHSQIHICKLENISSFPLEKYEFKYPKSRLTSAKKSKFIKKNLLVWRKGS
eukprot:snap_masked-scaffold_28-processed-gene-2.18-mRNA-1 protein AED:1.00 eAED:1.00 QI:0/-1/0/0/-1/1/1/0/99